MGRKSDPAAADLLGLAKQADLAALEEIGNGRRGLAGIAAATGNGEDQIAERELVVMNFVLFHRAVLRLVSDNTLGFSKSRATHIYGCVVTEI